VKPKPSWDTEPGNTEQVPNGGKVKGKNQGWGKACLCFFRTAAGGGGGGGARSWEYISCLLETDLLPRELVESLSPETSQEMVDNYIWLSGLMQLSVSSDGKSDPARSPYLFWSR
jgi:hypothetical protein